MVPNSPIHPDAAMRDDGSRETSPTKGNKTPGRKLSPPKHLAAPIVEVTENDSSEETTSNSANLMGFLMFGFLLRVYLIIRGGYKIFTNKNCDKISVMYNPKLIASSTI